MQIGLKPDNSTILGIIAFEFKMELVLFCFVLFLFWFSSGFGWNLEIFIT